ncbi:MAG: hypothetical protein GEU88_10540 [Solirubrobacterales bacterium]|nr:hypothetical protein [Solirubrobacterales bacterium]
MSVERASAAERHTEDTWREGLASHWSELATIRAGAAAKGRLGADAPGWASTALIGSMHQLSAVARGPEDLPECERLDRRHDCLWSAASALEACACVWDELGEVAGPRRTHLVRRLERHLTEHDRRALAGVANPLVTASAVAGAARAALEAIRSLRQGVNDRAESLDRLEDGAVRLAALGVREAFGLSSADAVDAGADPPPALVADLLALGRDTASIEGAQERVDRPDAIGWLCGALELRPPPPAAELTGGDPSRRAEALLASRRYWLELGGSEVRAIEGIERDLAAPCVRDAEHAWRFAAHRAAGLIARAGLAARWGEFDFAIALDYQSAGLRSAIRAYARGLNDDPDELQSARRLLLGRLARCLIARWVIERQLGLGEPAPSPDQRSAGSQG